MVPTKDLSRMGIVDGGMVSTFDHDPGIGL